METSILRRNILLLAFSRDIPFLSHATSACFAFYPRLLQSRSPIGSTLVWCFEVRLGDKMNSTVNGLSSARLLRLPTEGFDLLQKISVDWLHLRCDEHSVTHVLVQHGLFETLRGKLPRDGLYLLPGIEMWLHLWHFVSYVAVGMV